MISVDEARDFIRAHSISRSIRTMNMADACMYAAAEDVYATFDFPSFRQSAMDGYAIQYASYEKSPVFFVKREVAAGDTATHETILPGEAIRVFTGACVPEGADTVVMQEHVIRRNEQIEIQTGIQQGSHIRPVASQTQKGDCLVKCGQILTPGRIAFLAGMGVDQIKVYNKPRCSILTTGNELVQPGTKLIPGQIYESNSFALQAALKQLFIQPVATYSVTDDAQAIEDAIRNAFNETDILLLTGGISVGEYDFVYQALQKNQVETIFYKVKQKPGKPLFFGRRANKLVFALPGNPGSVLTCFYQYVWPCIQQIAGYEHPGLTVVNLPLLVAYEKKAGLTHFLKGRLLQHGVEVLDHQESYKMNAFAEADCLIEINETAILLEAGTSVNVYLLNSL